MGGQVPLGRDEAEPAPVPLAKTRGEVAHALQLAGGRSLLALVAQVAVRPLDLVGATGSKQPRKKVLRLELELHRAAGRQLDRAGSGEQCAHVGALRSGERQERAHTLEEDAVVADEVDDGDERLAVVGAKAAAELLEEHHRRLGRAQHHHAVDRRDVDPLVEHVDGAERVELAAVKRCERLLAIVRAGPRPDRRDADALRAKPRANEPGVRDAAAEHERSRARVGVPRAPQRFHARLGLRRGRQRLGVEPAIAPREVRVVDVVLHAVVAKRHEAPDGDASPHVGAVRDEVVEEPQDVGRVGAVGRRREAEEEPRVDCVENPPVRRGRGVVHLIDHDVIETLRAQTREVLWARELRDGGEHEVGAQVVALVDEPADPATGARRADERPVRLRGLTQQLLPVRDEQEARPRPGLRAQRVPIERSEPRLAEPRGEHDERAPTPLRAGEAQRFERLDLHRVRLGRRHERLGLGVARRQRAQGFARARGVLLDPGGVEHACAAPRLLEGSPYAGKGDRVAVAVDSEVPFRARLQRSAREVAAADEGRPELVGLEEPRLGVERAPRHGWHLDDARLESARGALPRVIDGGRLLPVEERLERAGLRDVEVVPRDEADRRATGERRLDRGRDATDPRLLHEGRHDRDARRAVEERQDVTREGVGAAARGERRRALGRWPGGSQVVRLRREDVAHAAARIGDVARVARDDVHVEVEHRLPPRGADVDADVVPVRPVALLDAPTGDLGRPCERLALLVRRVEPGRDVPSRNEQRVPRAHRERVPQAHDDVVLVEHPARVGVTERAERGATGHRSRVAEARVGNEGERGSGGSARGTWAVTAPLRPRRDHGPRVHSRPPHASNRARRSASMRSRTPSTSYTSVPRPLRRSATLT